MVGLVDACRVCFPEPLVGTTGLNHSIIHMPNFVVVLEVDMSQMRGHPSHTTKITYIGCKN